MKGRERTSAAPQTPIVSELGRPETPEETAARKTAASSKRRANQTLVNLLLSLLASLAVVLVIVLVVVRPDSGALARVDYQQVARQAQSSVSVTLASPALPRGWSANAAQLDSKAADTVSSWYIGLITPSEQFIGLRQGIDANPTWVAKQLDNARATDSATVAGIHWTVYNQRTAKDPGNLAYAMMSVVAGSTFVLFGTASDTEFETLATSLADQLSQEGE